MHSGINHSEKKIIINRPISHVALFDDDIISLTGHKLAIFQNVLHDFWKYKMVHGNCNSYHQDHIANHAFSYTDNVDINIIITITLTHMITRFIRVSRWRNLVTHIISIYQVRQYKYYYKHIAYTRVRIISRGDTSHRRKGRWSDTY